jgi:ankyrin repeat protein
MRRSEDEKKMVRVEHHGIVMARVRWFRFGWLGVAAFGFVACSPGASEIVDAAKRGDAASMRTLLDRGRSLEARDGEGNTPLMLASLYGDAALVKLLLARQADPRAKNHEGATALLWSVDDRDKVEALLAAGADPRASASSGFTPLIAAANCHANAPVVKLLLDRGADANQASPTGTTALLLAPGSDSDTVKLLLDRGANVRARNAAGATALHVAASRGDVDSARLLLDAGADPNVRDVALGRTPLHWAAQAGAAKVVAVLLERGADPNMRESLSGMTPLMQAAAAERAGADLVQALLAAGADPSIVDRRGTNASTWALRRGDAVIARAIEARGGAPGTIVKTEPLRAAVDDTPANVKRALERTIPLLERAGPAFRDASGCVSCHHQALPAMALGRLKEKGYAIDAAAQVAEARAIVAELRPLRQRLLQGAGLADLLDGPYLLTGLGATAYPRDETTDAVTRYLVLRQTREGRWRVAMQRPPSDGSDLALTALAVRSLATYGHPARVAAPIDLARAWLRRAETWSNEDVVFKALGLKWAGASAADIEDAIATLLGAQRSDGGFAQLPPLGSDAYATGQAVVALREAGALPADDSTIRRAVRYLLSSQLADGSWFVRTRSPQAQPFIESGFPHGHSQFISIAATSWAAMALASVE